MRIFTAAVAVACAGAVSASAQTVLDGAPAATDAAAAGGVVDVYALSPDSYRASATRLGPGETIRLDGRLDEAAWERAAPQGNFVQREPNLGHPATERTEFRVLYDDRFIYFAISAYDSDYSGIVASELRRDSSLRKGDHVKIIIDTFKDSRNGFFFATNPLGALKDEQHIDNGRTVNSQWNAVWDVRTSADERGWYSEIAIPLKQLRFRGGPGENVWGLNVCREVVRKNEDSYWVPYPREWGPSGFSRLSNAGRLTGLRDLAPGRRLEIVPFVSPAMFEDMQAAAPASFDRRFGFDARVGLTSTLTADLTYKTDFAQVEANEETVNLSRFDLFFDEKRQFFTEAAGIFGYGAALERPPGQGQGGPSKPGLLQLFDSGRIGQSENGEVPIDVGGRVTGRVGAYELGVMSIRTGRGPSALEAGGADPVDPAVFSIVRVKRGLFGRSSVGGILLNRAGGAGDNGSVGADLNLSLGQNFLMAGLVAKTFTPGLRGKDVASALDILFRTDRWNAGATYADIPENFNAEMGFIRRTDVRNVLAKAAWTPRPDWPGVRQLEIKGTRELFQDQGGHLISRTDESAARARFHDGSSLRLTLSQDYDLLTETWEVGPAVLSPGGYRWTTAKANYSSNEARRVYGELQFDAGGYYGGQKRSYKVEANVNPFGSLLIETTYRRNRVDFPALPPYLTTTVSNRISYSFSPSLYLKSFVQYNSDTQLASLNLLLWYIHRPGSDLYVVYNQGWDTDLPGVPRVKPRDRSLSVKFTWWLSR